MSKPIEAPDNPRVLVVDDNENFVKSLVLQFERASIRAEGISDPAKVLAWTTSQRFSHFDIIFLDMRLGITKDGRSLAAADLLMHIMTYYPTAKVVVFTQKEVSVEECVSCIRFGALGFIPKVSTIDHFILIANVYRKLADEGQTYEERIRSLWVDVNDRNNPTKGRHLEMLMTNIFNSMPGFRVISNNAVSLSGEIDLTVENLGRHDFWQRINSYHLLIECKNVNASSEKKIFHVLARKVAAKASCNIGILVSWSGVSKGFRDLREAEPGLRIFALDHNDLSELVRLTPEARELYLRTVFGPQL